MSEQIIAKYGGTSMARPEVVAGVADRFPEQKVIIVSAPGKSAECDEKITDTLLGLVGKSQREFNNGRDAVINRLATIYSSLGSNALRRLSDEASDLLDHQYSQNPAYIASTGEQLSARYFSELIGAVYARPEIVFKSDGSLDRPATKRAVRKQYAAEPQRMIVPGFYGKDRMGRRHLLARGGSDRTGAIYAEALGLNYHNFTDTNGIYSADPKIVSDATTIRQATRDEVREGAHGGSGVFQGDAIVDLNGSAVRVLVCNTFDVDAPHTEILNSRKVDDNQPVIAVSGKRVWEIAVHDLGMANQLGYVADVIESVASMALQIEHIPAAQDSLSITIPADADEDKIQYLVEYLRINRAASKNAQVSYGLKGVVYLIGEALRSPMAYTQVVARLGSAMVHNNIWIEDIVSNRQSPSLAMLVDGGKVDAVIDLLHNEFIAA